MISIKTITPPEWMTTEAASLVMKLLEGDRDAPKTLFVGGCVRNELLGYEIADIDMATQFTPEEVTQRLQGENVKVIPTGVAHGTVTALVDGQHFEITTLRQDVETDGRRAVTAYTNDWVTDAQRRDFTINSLLVAPDGRIFDPLGVGLKDIEARRVVFIGDPHQRIAEDVLRILRFFRFHLYYGQGEMDADGLTACRNAAGKIKDLSRERVTQEVLKILNHPAPAPVLKIMFEHAVLSDLPDADFDMQILEGLETRSALLRVFVLAGLKARFFEKQLILSNAQKREIKALHEAYCSFEDVSEKSIKIMMYRYGREAAAQIYDLKSVTDCIECDPQMRDILDHWDIPVFPITGADLIAQGVPQGPELGERLKALEEAWIKEGL